jgi:hypothetical protein
MTAHLVVERRQVDTSGLQPPSKVELQGENTGGDGGGNPGGNPGPRRRRDSVQNSVGLTSEKRPGPRTAVSIAAICDFASCCRSIAGTAG